MKQSLKISFTLISFIILIIYLYFPMLNADYVWDDALLFVNKTGLIEQPLSWSLISGPVLPNTSYFRPLVFLFWYTEFHLFGLNSNISHIIGLIIFIINNIFLYALVYVVAKRLKYSNPLIPATLATLLYLTHPSLIESTAWVSGRFDQLYTLFSLLALVIFSIKYKNNEESISWLSGLAIAFCYLCALLSKEAAVWLPLILFIFYIIFEPSKSYLELIKAIFSKQLNLVFLLISFFCFYAFLRVISIDGFGLSITQNYFEVIILQNIIPLHAIKYYFIQIFSPFSSTSLLQPLSAINQNFLSRSSAYLSGFFVLFLFYFAIFKRNISGLLAVCAFIYLFMVLYFIPVGIADNIGHSRFLTLPMVFVVMAIVFIPYKKIINLLNISYKKILLLGLFVLTFWFALALVTVKTIVPFWNNEYSLWYWAYQTHPNSNLARSNYLNALIHYKKFNEVIKIGNDYIAKHGALEVGEQITYATALYNINDVESLSYFEGVIDILPKLHQQNDMLARKKADYFVLSAVQMSDAYALYALALVKFNGDIQGAIKNLEIANWYLLDDQKEYLNYYLAAVLYLNKQYDEAIELYNKQKIRTLKRGDKNYIYTPSIIYQYCKERNDKEVCEKISKQKF